MSYKLVTHHLPWVSTLIKIWPGFIPIMIKMVILYLRLPIHRNS